MSVAVHIYEAPDGRVEMMSGREERPADTSGRLTELSKAAKVGSLGRRQKAMKKDNNCFWHAINDQLGVICDESSQQDLRTRTVAYLAAHYDEWHVEVAEHRKHDLLTAPMTSEQYTSALHALIGKTGEWADNTLCVSAVSAFLGRDVVIIYNGHEFACRVRHRVQGVRAEGDISGYRDLAPWTVLLPWIQKYSPLVLCYNGNETKVGNHFDSTCDLRNAPVPDQEPEHPLPAEVVLGRVPRKSTQKYRQLRHEELKWGGHQIRTSVRKLREEETAIDTYMFRKVTTKVSIAHHSPS
jgi:hypothetical protein